MTRSARWLKLINTLKIRTPSLRVVPLRLNTPQQMVWEYVKDDLDHKRPIRLIILKARREGISTLIESLLLAFAATTDNVKALVTAHLKDPAFEIWNMSKLFVETSSLLSQLAIVENNEIRIGRSVLKIATAGSPEAQRGTDLTAWHASEGAFYAQPQVMTATMQSLPRSPRTFSIGAIESTANGRSGDGETFYNEWNRAVKKKSQWRPVFLAWHIFKDYVYDLPGLALEDVSPEEYALRQRFELTDAQLAWRRWCIANDCGGSVDRFHAEYPSCVRAGTRVSTDLGLVKIEDARSATVTETGRIRAWGPQPKSLLYRLDTVAGRFLEGTADHPVRLASGEWKGLAALEPGERIRLLPPRFAEREYVETWQSIPAATTTVRVTRDLAVLLGYFLGDGAWYKGNFGIACAAKDGDVVDDVAQLVRGHLGEPRFKSVGQRQGQKGCVYVNISRMAALPVLGQLGLVCGDGRGHYKKRLAVPECIWRSPHDVVAGFLSGLFEADGAVSKAGQVSFYSKSLDFLRDVQLLLLGFGIPVQANRVERKTGSGRVYVGYAFTMGRVASSIFGASIGFRGARKRGRYVGPHPSGRPAESILLEDVVRAVVPIEEEVSWDLTVEPTHIFSANGIETHNTAEEAFIMSGLPFFRPEHLLPIEGGLRDGVKGTVELDGRFTRQEQGYLEVFEFPKPGHTYVVGADSSMGIADGDSGRQHSRSAAEVIDMETLAQVAEYDAISAPHIFSRHLAGIGRLYNEALLAPEVQSSGGGGGREIIVYLRNEPINYWNLHRWRRPDEIQKTPGFLYGWECLDPLARVLTADLRWVEADQIKEGDRLVGCRETCTGGRGSAIPVRLQTVVHRQVFVAPMVEVVLANGQQTRVSVTHPFLTFRESRKDIGWQWRVAKNVKPGDRVRYLPMWDAQTSFAAGRLSGLLDGEGHLARSNRRGGYQMLVTQVEGELAQEIRDLWFDLGFTYTFKWVRHKDRPQEQDIATSGVLRLTDVLRALGSLRPTRLLRRFATLAEQGVLTLRAFHSVPVASVKAIGDGPVVGLTTDPDHTLIADGIVGHNTNARTRPRMLARIREVVMEQSSRIYSRALFDQLSAFGEDDHGHEVALAGHDDLLFAYGIALMSRSENYFKPVNVMPAAPAEPNWESLGLHVIKEETQWDRLQRKIRLAGMVAPEKTFLQY